MLQTTYTVYTRIITAVVVVVVVAVVVVVVVAAVAVAVVAVVVVVAVVGITACSNLWVCKMFRICITTKSVPRLHEVPVYYKYVFRLGQTPLFKTCFPCRRNTHLYMSYLPS